MTFNKWYCKLDVARPTKSQNVADLYFNVKLPVYMLYAQPEGPPGAKGLENTKISLFSCLDKQLDGIIEKLNEQGVKGIESRQLTTQLPARCPVCDEKNGAPTFNYDTRKVSEKRKLEKKTEIPRIRIWYNHYRNGKTKRCYVGYWENGGTELKNGLDIRKVTSRAFG